MRVFAQLLPLAAAIEGLEGLALGGYAVYAGVETVAGEPNDAGSAWALAGTMLVLGAMAVFAAMALYRRRRWSRGPAVATQIFALPVAVTFLQAGRSGVGAILVVAAVAGLVALLHPATTRKLLEQHAGS